VPGTWLLEGFSGRVDLVSPLNFLSVIRLIPVLWLRSNGWLDCVLCLPGVFSSDLLLSFRYLPAETFSIVALIWCGGYSAEFP